jgi:hypothetical protein
VEPSLSRRLVRVVSLLLPAAMIVCASPEGQRLLPTEPDFVGFITSIDRGGAQDPPARLNVESHAGKIVRRHVVRLTRETVLIRRDGDVRRPIGVEEFELKNWVRVWFSDPGRQEYPTNVTARQVEVVDRP